MRCIDRVAIGVFAGLCILAAPAAAQTPVGTLAPPDSLASIFRPVSPGGAFLRAVLVPGWGHTAIGSHTRAGFYVALQGTALYGLFRTQERIGAATARAELRERSLRSSLAADGVVDPDEIETALDGDEILEDLEGLVDSRRQQREDWVAIGIFLLMLSGADAYVSAHLQHFPTPIEVDAGTTAAGRMELRARVPIGR